MKFALIFSLLALGAGLAAVGVQQGLDTLTGGASSAPVSGAAIPTEPNGVSPHCREVTEKIWPYSVEADPGLQTLSSVPSLALLKHAGTAFCACAESKLGKHRSQGSKALFGTLAGHDMALRFSKHFTRKRKELMQKDLQKLAQRHRRIVEERPDWLKTINQTFRQCRKESEISSNLLSSIIRLQQ